DHGEGGLIVGKLQPRVLVVDDVITAGTAIRESMDLIAAQEGLTVVGVVVAMDREERVQEGNDMSAIQQVQKDFGIPVVSIAKMRDLISFLEVQYTQPDKDELLKSIQGYREQYGISD
ncbi:unnamed protein product, partial [Polarella glacialis]